MGIKQLITMYIKYRHSLGYKYVSNERILKSFARYIGEETPIIEVTTFMCTGFLYGKDMSNITKYWQSKYGALRGFYDWAMARGHVPTNPLPAERPKMAVCKTPHIYSNEELRTIFRYALEHPKNPHIVPNRCMQMILMIIFFMGLRTQEAMALTLSDIDIRNNAVHIRCTKFFKSRIVPFNSQVREKILTFLKWREGQGFCQAPNSHLFIGYDGKPIKIKTIRNRWEELRQLANLTTAGKWQPCLHDFRHTFAVNRLVLWYKEGKDVQNLLPILSTYMGHTQLSHTSVYLTMTGELLREANLLFHSYALEKTEEK